MSIGISSGITPSEFSSKFILASTISFSFTIAFTKTGFLLQKYRFDVLICVLNFEKT